MASKEAATITSTFDYLKPNQMYGAD